MAAKRDQPGLMSLSNSIDQADGLNPLPNLRGSLRDQQQPQQRNRDMCCWHKKVVYLLFQ